MGLFDVFTEIVKAPISVAIDVVEVVANPFEKDECETLKSLERIKEALDD